MPISVQYFGIPFSLASFPSVSIILDSHLSPVFQTTHGASTTSPQCSLRRGAPIVSPFSTSFISPDCDYQLPINMYSSPEIWSLLASGTRGFRLDFFSSRRPPKSRLHFCISVMMPSGRILKSLPDFSPHVTRYSRRGGTPVHSPHFLVIASSQSSPTKI